MTLPALLFAIIVGFNHAFEADHVLAVGNLANKRASFMSAMKDGLFWGLGHTSMIIVVGCIIILAKLTLNISSFEYLEVIVGITLIALGIYRALKINQKVVSSTEADTRGGKLAFIIGTIHGLAGSGAVVLIAMSEIKSSSMSIAYILLFGIGSILGMILVAALFKIPMTNKLRIGEKLQKGFLWVSALLCIAYGVYMVFKFIG
ncbi:MAG: urease accessory protein [Bacteroidota bacterium]